MNDFRRCNRCVMDTTADDIVFDELGNCNFCTDLLKKLNNPYVSGHRKDELNHYIEQIKKEGKNREYDCIVGLSGGADSSYTLYLVKQAGLRPLAVHMDNGWNSELATNNIKNLVDKLDVHLHTHVINWDEYRALMQAFFDADVIDIELLYDNAMLAVNYNLAEKYRIKYILSGSNSATEGMMMPTNWNWNKYDKKNIYCIAKRNSVKIQSLPTISKLRFHYLKSLKKIHWVPFLDYYEYNKEKAMDFLVKEYSYKKYPYKHYESIFTRLYQGYILPKKFNVDKRLLHLSSLICSKQTTRELALKDLERIPYPSDKELQDDIEYFLKKMGWSVEEFDDYLTRPETPHLYYGSEQPLLKVLNKIYHFVNINR